MLINIDVLESMRRVMIQFLGLIEDELIKAGKLQCRTILDKETRRKMRRLIDERID